MKEAAAGIDIGGTNTLIGLVDREGGILSESTLPTQAYGTAELFVSDVRKKIEAGLASLSGHYTLKGIGIGAPNGSFYKGTIEYAANLPWKGVIPLVDLVKKHYHVPVYLTNDANAAAIGEMIYGKARGMKDFIVVTLGTGVGSGFVANGEVIYGHDGFAGELGHTTVIPDGRDCGCGRKGCLETYTSAGGIKRTVFQLLAESKAPSGLRSENFNDLTSKTISEYAKKGDVLALEAFRLTGKILGMRLADAVAITSPEAIFLFGGLAQAGPFILEPTQKFMEENMLEVFKGKVKLMLSGLKESNAAILGASALVWKEAE